jgi:hypothetical protein
LAAFSPLQVAILLLACSKKKAIILGGFFVHIDLFCDPWFAELGFGQEIRFFGLNQLILQKLLQMHSIIF